MRVYVCIQAFPYFSFIATEDTDKSTVIASEIFYLIDAVLPFLDVSILVLCLKC